MNTRHPTNPTVRPPTNPSIRTPTNPSIPTQDSRMGETSIGKSLTIEGEITGTEPLVVQGTVKGRITLNNGVSVAEGGMVEADVSSATLDVAGAMQGNAVVSERFEIKAGGQMHGDVQSPRVLIADGALYKGNIMMEIPE